MNRPEALDSSTALAIATGAAEAPPLVSARTASLVGAALVALGPISLALYTPAMPALVTAFGTSVSTIKLTLTLYFAGFASAQLVCGPLSDAYGRRPITLWFMGLYLIGSVIAIFAPTVEYLLVARLIQGIGAAAGVAIARAIVRDLFNGQEAARIMNTVGIILALGPAISPTIGGITLDLLGWHAIFVLMVIYGLFVVGLVVYVVVETNRAPDRALARPSGLVKAYGTLLGDHRFMLPGIILGSSIGAFFTLATVLPFVLIGRVGLTPTHFGFAMILQSGSFVLGGLLTRKLLVQIEASKLVLPGLLLATVATVVLAVLLTNFPPTVWTVMIPISVVAFANALIMPSPSTAALAPFPHMAGAAAAMLGFMQMGGGFLGSLVAAFFPNPVMALAAILPVMLGIGLAARLMQR